MKKRVTAAFLKTQKYLWGYMCANVCKLIQALVQYYSTNILPFNMNHVTGLIYTDCQDNTAQLYALFSNIFIGVKNIH